MGKRITTLVLALIVMALLAPAVWAQSPPYKRVEEIPEGQGVVYIYRPSSWWLKQISCQVEERDKYVAWVKEGSYYPFLAKAGENNLHIRKMSHDTLNPEMKAYKPFNMASYKLQVEAGQSYYLKVEVKSGISAPESTLELVPLEKAEQEITDCLIINPRANITY